MHIYIILFYFFFFWKKKEKKRTLCVCDLKHVTLRCCILKMTNKGLSQIFWCSAACLICSFQYVIRTKIMIKVILMIIIVGI